MYNAWIAGANNLPAQHGETYLQNPFTPTHPQPSSNPLGRTVSSLTATLFQPLSYLQLSIIRLHILISIHRPSHRPIVDSPTCPAASTPTPGLGAAAQHVRGADEQRRQQEGKAAASAGQPVQSKYRKRVRSTSARAYQRNRCRWAEAPAGGQGPQLLQIDLCERTKQSAVSVDTSTGRSGQQEGRAAACAGQPVHMQTKPSLTCCSSNAFSPAS